MTTDAAILPETRLLRLVHGSGDLPEGAEGLSMEHYEVLSELRGGGGARMYREWPTREGRATPPTLRLSILRVVGRGQARDVGLWPLGRGRNAGWGRARESCGVI